MIPGQLSGICVILCPRCRTAVDAGPAPDDLRSVRATPHDDPSTGGTCDGPALNVIISDFPRPLGLKGRAR